MGSTKWGHQRKAVALVMTDILGKSSVHHRFFCEKVKNFRPGLAKARPDDDDQRTGKGEQHVGDSVSASIAECGNVAARGIADDLHRRGAGARAHHRAEQQRAVHA